LIYRYRKNVEKLRNANIAIDETNRPDIKNAIHNEDDHQIVVTDGVEIEFAAPNAPPLPPLVSRFDLRTMGIFVFYTAPMKAGASLMLAGYFGSIKYVLSVLILSQQACVMLPLTNMVLNPYCVEIYTPSDDTNAVCLYVYAVNAIPYFFYFSFATIAGMYLTKCIAGIKLDDGDNKNGIKCAVVFAMFSAAAGTIFCMFMAAAFIVYYVFAGFFIGLWFVFGMLGIGFETLIPEALGMAIFMLTEIVGKLIAGR
jgi:hypothetical protein